MICLLPTSAASSYPLNTLVSSHMAFSLLLKEGMLPSTWGLSVPDSFFWEACHTQQTLFPNLPIRIVANLSSSIFPTEASSDLSSTV
jgi:hypothetical protein